MRKVLVVQGSGLNMRGKAKNDVWGPLSLEQYNEHIRKYASELGFEVEIFHSNIEGEVNNKFCEAHDRGFDAAIFNPGAYSRHHPALVSALTKLSYPVFEVHVSNPALRGIDSEVAHVCRGVVNGYGVFGYYLALRGIKEILDAK